MIVFLRKLTDKVYLILNRLGRFVPLCCAVAILALSVTAGINGFSARATTGNRFQLQDGKADGKFLMDTFGDSFIQTTSLFDGYCDKQIKLQFLACLDAAPVAVVCKPTGYFKGVFRSHEQTVEVLDVIKGDPALRGQTISYIGMLCFSHDNGLSEAIENVKEQEKVAYSSLNFMKPDDTYLFFLNPYGGGVSVPEIGKNGKPMKAADDAVEVSRPDDTLNKPGWYTLDWAYYAPFYFDLTQRRTQNVLTAKKDGVSVQPYSGVRDNEVFVADRKAENWFYALKEEVFNKYLSGTKWLVTTKEAAE